MRHVITYTALVLILNACEQPHKEGVELPQFDTVISKQIVTDSLIPDEPQAFYINTAAITSKELVEFAITLKGIPYEYACASPEQGFDCSGFVNYVFDHFGIDAPRSSVGFTNVGKEVSIEAAKPGDIILFTGTNPGIRTVGHIGIITFHESDSLSFIHSSSGSANGVTITPLNAGYRERFMKIVRVFKENE